MPGIPEAQSSFGPGFSVLPPSECPEDGSPCSPLFSSVLINGLGGATSNDTVAVALWGIGKRFADLWSYTRSQPQKRSNITSWFSWNIYLYQDDTVRNSLIKLKLLYILYVRCFTRDYKLQRTCLVVVFPAVVVVVVFVLSVEILASHASLEHAR